MTGGDPQIGDVIDSRYRITGRLGSGGMGSVYRAEHLTIRRPVAIKVLHPDFAGDPDHGKRFQREAFVTGRTDHPNCVTVSDFGPLEGGGFYLVMELVDGVVLGDLMTQVGRLPVRRALHIARHILRGLGHAHAAGIVHRDVKPNNVVLVRQGDDADFAKILDFGIAKLVEGAPVGTDAGDQQITRIGTTVGTPTYVAPEQAVGGAVDPRSDLYSLSVMLFEMIAGDPPFRAEDTVNLLGKHLAAPVPTMSEVVPGLVVAPAVEELVRVGLAKNKASRYAGAEAYAAAIDDVIARGLVDAPLPIDGGSGAGAAVSGAAASGTSGPGTIRPDMASGTGVVARGRLAEPGPPAPPTSIRPSLSPRGRKLVLGFGAALVLIIMIVASTGQGGGVAMVRAPPRPGARPAPAFPILTAPVAASEPAAGEAAPADDPPDGAREDAPDDAREDARAELDLGHQRISARRAIEGLEAYRRALALDPDLAADETMAGDAERLVGARDGAVAMAALEVLGEMDGEGARDQLVELASRDKRSAIRRRARALAEKRGAGDQIDRLSSYALDLVQGRSCEERAEAVPALRELGDRRALDVLERARKRRTGGILGFGRRSVNGCMRAQLDEAIAHLKEL
ncbi:MAG TPA: serine/threonine-protein kinase [Kofleriaceae bacterium]|nr:serine/threonine-protein kinase [Kofleriaceae bacterium]